MQRVLIAVFVLLGGTVHAQEKTQFVLAAGSAQIGSAPGRVDLLRPTLRILQPNDRIQFQLTLVGPRDWAPCSTGECVATVSYRRTNDRSQNGRIDVGYAWNDWSTFLLPPVGDGPVSMDLPSLVPHGAVLRPGSGTLFVAIRKGDEDLFLYALDVSVQ